MCIRNTYTCLYIYTYTMCICMCVCVYVCIWLYYYMDQTAEHLEVLDKSLKYLL